MNPPFAHLSHGNYITWYILLMLLATFFATIRAALSLTGRTGAARLCKKYPEKRTQIYHWLPRWDMLRVTVLLLATLMNAAGITCGVMLVMSLGDAWIWLEIAGIILFSTFIMILALNILPQALSEGYADRISMIFLPIIQVIAWFTWPIAWPLAKLDRRLRQKMISGSDEDDRPTAEEAIRSLVSSDGSNDLEEEEREIIRSVFEFGDTVTREIMIPRVDMEGFEDSETIETCAKKLSASRFSRYPVYHESLDDIRGAVHIKDVLRVFTAGGAVQPVGQAVKAVPFVPESMPINDLLQLLRTEQSQMAIVVDEYGGTAGLVSMEDIIEELVGEIQDEYDGKSDEGITRLSDGSVVASARLLVDELNDLLHLHIPLSEEYDSLGGYVTSRLGHIPRPGETIEAHDCHITVQSANAKLVHSLRIQINPHPGS